MSSSFYDHTSQEHELHFLRSCFMCNKPLELNHDIYMYRGNTPFCSEDCRNKQIEMDDHSRKKKSCNTLKRVAEAPVEKSNANKKK